LFSKPVVDDDRCLRNGPGRSGCTVCQDNCPVPGFKLNGGTVTLPDECNFCHLCTAACPEGAIRGQLPPSRLLSLTEIRLKCERVYKQGVASIPCIGAIPKVFLEVASIQQRSLYLVTGSCNECECRVGLSLFEKRIAQVRKTRSLKCRRHELPFSEIPERRLLLGRLVRSVTSFGMRATDYRELVPEELISDADRIRPVFTDKCIGCPVCEVVCPHHVFHREETDKGVRYKIKEQLCTDCRKCLDSCPFQGVTLERTSQRTVRSIELDRKICDKCDEHFFGQASACPRCRKTKTLEIFAK
jgi:NAD-dependent dihydropyrimidine dehydrogenase PreA subunit